MTKPLVFMFSGQGSHYYGMGRELYKHDPVFKEWMIRLDARVSSRTGRSVIDELYDPKRGTKKIFDQISYTHPAIFMVEYALAQAFLSRGIKPHYVMGTSMGEFAAAAVSGMMAPEDVLDVVIGQAESLEGYCGPGGMLAVIDNIRIYRDISSIRDNSELAAINCDSHFVVAGTASDIRKVEHVLKSNNILYQVLPVSFGFHSANINPAGPVFRNYVSRKRIHPPCISFISCVSGAPFAPDALDYFWNIVREPIRFPDAFNWIEAKEPCCYVDLGPGGTLATFAKRNMSPSSASESRYVMTRFHQDFQNLDRIAMELRP